MRLKIVSEQLQGRHDVEDADCLRGASCAVTRPSGIGEQGDAGVADADQRQAGFDGAQLAWWACWAGPIEPSNQASLVMLRMKAASAGSAPRSPEKIAS